MKRRKTYIVATTYTSIKTYEILATNAEEAKQLVRDGYRKQLLDITETFNVESAYRKEKKR